NVTMKAWLRNISFTRRPYRCDEIAGKRAAGRTPRHANECPPRSQGGVMKLRKWWLAGAVVAFLSANGPALAQQVPATEPDFPRGRISGYLFGDLYYNTVGDPLHVYSGTGADLGKANIDGAPGLIGKDLNGMQIRRIYFQADNDLSIKFSTRFRLEADSKALTSDGKIGVYVKAAYLQAKNVYPGGSFFVGM